MEDPPERVQALRLDHIALAAPRIADAAGFLAGELGGTSGYGGPSGDFRWWHWDFPNGGRIEVIEPDGPAGGFVHRFLESRGPGIHHVTFDVPDLRAICRRAEAQGYPVVGYRDESPRWKEAFLHPKQAMGVVIQFSEHAPGDGDPAEFYAAEPPPEPARRQPAVDVVGLRMVAPAAEPALAQWRDLLGGEVEAAADALVFRWADSPMVVRVRLAPGAEAASEAVEIDADRALPTGLHARLGARFERPLGSQPTSRAS